RSPHSADELTTDACSFRRAPGENSLRGGDDGNSEAVEDQRKVRRLEVGALAGPRRALDAGDDVLVPVVLQLHGQRPETETLFALEVLDVPFGLKDARDLDLDLRGRHLHGRVARCASVAD